MVLQLIPKDDPASVVEARSFPFIIGSGNGCDYRLQASGVSSRHAAIVEIKRRYYVVDLQSTNGTHVIASSPGGGARSQRAPVVLDPGKVGSVQVSPATELSEGAMLALGNILFTCRVPVRPVAEPDVARPEKAACSHADKSAPDPKAVSAALRVVLALVVAVAVVALAILLMKDNKRSIPAAVALPEVSTDNPPAQIMAAIPPPVPASQPSPVVQEEPREPALEKPKTAETPGIAVAGDGSGKSMATAVESLMALEKCVRRTEGVAVDYKEAGRLAGEVRNAVPNVPDGADTFKGQLAKILGPLKEGILSDVEDARRGGDYLRCLKRLRDGLLVMPDDADFHAKLDGLEPDAKTALRSMVTRAYWLENDRSPEKRAQADALYREIAAATSPSDWTRPFHDTAVARRAKP